MGRPGISRSGRERLVRAGVWQGMGIGLENLRRTLVRFEPRDGSGLWFGCVRPIAQQVSTISFASFQSRFVHVGRS